MRKSLLFLLGVSLFIYMFSPVKVNAGNNIEEKVYCNASIEENFIDNEIMVIVGKEKSLNYYEFKTMDFIDIGCESIKDLTESRKNEVLSAVNGAKNNVNISTFRRILLLTLNKNDKQNVLDCIKILEKRDDIISCEPNYGVLNASGPNINTTLGYEIGTNNIIEQWAISKISLQLAWNVENYIDELENINVGIIDYGIKADESVGGVCEPELIGKVNQNLSYNFITSTAITDYNPLSEISSAHGTFIAGIIAARSDDYFGIEGVSKTSRLVSLRVHLMDADYNEQYECSEGVAQIINAINYASVNNIKLLNASFIIPNYCAALKLSIENYSGLIVCCAGNYGTNNDTIQYYPASFDLDNVISVGATDINDEKWESSNYGKTSVDLFAPGVNIISVGHMGQQLTDEGFENYYISLGTSFATPYVVGVAAMIWSRYPNLTAGEVKERILLNVDVIPGLENYCLTGGRLNAYKAYINEHTAHNYRYSLYDGDYHKKMCPGCNYSVYEEHDWVPLLRLPIVPSIALVCNKCGERKL